MRIGLTAVAVPIALVLATASCASRARAPSASSAAAARGGASTRAIAPAGRVFVVRLDTPLDSDRLVPAARVRTYLDEPLLARDGAVIAPVATPLLGRVQSVENGEGLGRITLRLDALELAGRLYPIDARVRFAESSRVTHPEPASPDAIVSNLYPDVPPMTSTAAGGGPRRVPLFLAAGTKLQLVLTRPFELTPEESLPSRE